MKERISVLFLGRKSSAVECLRHLLEKGFDVKAVVSPKPVTSVEWHEELRKTATKHSIPFHLTHEEILNVRKEQPMDFVLSVLYPKKIPQQILSLAKLAALNWHPAPLPEFRGFRGYSAAIMEERKQYGVSVHHMSPEFDAGDIVETHWFSIDPENETALSLERKTQRVLVELFQSILDKVGRGMLLPRIPQGEGRYTSLADLEKSKEIFPSDDVETIKKKIRAYWFPPYEGAFIRVKEEKFTLMDKKLLEQLGAFLSPDS